MNVLPDVPIFVVPSDRIKRQALEEDHATIDETDSRVRLRGAGPGVFDLSCYPLRVSFGQNARPCLAQE
jgi:hypothetical protein